MTDAKNTLDKATTAVTEKTEAKSAANNTLSNKTIAANTAAETLTAAQDTLKTEQAKLKSLNDNASALATAAATAKTTLDQKTSAYNAAVSTSEEKAAALQSAEDAKQAIKDKAASTKKTADEKAAAADTAKKAAKTNSDSLTAAQADLADAQADLETKKAALDAATADYNEKQAAADTAKKEADTAKAEADSLQKKLDDLKTAEEAKESASDTLEKAKDTLTGAKEEQSKAQAALSDARTAYQNALEAKKGADALVYETVLAEGTSDPAYASINALAARARDIRSRVKYPDIVSTVNQALSGTGVTVTTAPALPENDDYIVLSNQQDGTKNETVNLFKLDWEQVPSASLRSLSQMKGREMDIQMGKYTTLSRSFFDKLFAMNPLAVRIHFTYKGKNYVFLLPKDATTDMLFGKSQFEGFLKMIENAGQTPVEETEGIVLTNI